MRPTPGVDGINGSLRLSKRHLSKQWLRGPQPPNIYDLSEVSLVLLFLLVKLRLSMKLPAWEPEVVDDGDGFLVNISLIGGRAEPRSGCTTHSGVDGINGSLRLSKRHLSKQWLRGPQPPNIYDISEVSLVMLFLLVKLGLSVKLLAWEPEVVSCRKFFNCA